MPRGRGRGSNKQKKPKDPHKPKTNPSSYLLFNNDVRESFREKYPDKTPGERAKLVAAKWKKMTIAEKKPYNDKSAVLRAEYMTKMTEYKKTEHYKQHQNRIKQWKQQCIDMENSDDDDNDNNNKNHQNQRKKNWKEFKERREQENEQNKNKNKNNNIDNEEDDNNDENDENDEKMEIEKSTAKKTKNVNEWNWYAIIQWINRIENGRFKHKKYSNIKKIWKESKIKGYELFAINDFVLRMGGITDNNDRKILLKHIMGLNDTTMDDKNDVISKIYITECDVPNEICCPISFEIMDNPVLCTVSGHSYEKEVIEEYVNDKHEDPLTRQHVTIDKLVPNRALRDMIQTWKSKHIVQD